MKKILVVNANWIGDVVFSSPVFRALREHYPQAHIVCLTVPRVREIAESIPWIDETIIYDEKGRHRHPWTKLGLVMQLARYKFDAAFLLHRSLTRALLVYLAGIPQRVGYDTKGRGRFLTHRIPLALDHPPVHRSDHYLKVVEAFGIPATDRTYALKVSEESRQEVDGILRAKGVNEEDRILVVNPGGNWGLKRWPAGNFSRMIERIALEKTWKIVICGGPQDLELVQGILGAAGAAGGKVINVAGEVNLKQLIALTRRAGCVVSADSGPSHIASAVGTAEVIIFGPTRPEITGPRGKGRVVCLQEDVGCNRAACYHLGCPDNVCMRAVTVKDVYYAIEQIGH